MSRHGFMVTEAVWPRGIARRLQEALADTPVVLLNGPRQCGKTTLVRQFTTEQHLCRRPRGSPGLHPPPRWGRDR
jgi:predicted AAA+ superfamily ATPase